MRGFDRSRFVLRVLATGSAVALAVGMVAAPAIAADSRVLYVGTNLVDANEDGIPDNNGILTPTPVEQGGSTLIDITVLSGDNQTVANSTLFFPRIDPVTLTQGTLATGLTIDAVFGPDSGGCDWIRGASSLSCDLGNIEGYGHRDISIVVAVAPGFSTSATGLFSANVETNNENGDNNQIFAAFSGAFKVSLNDPDSVSTFVPPGQVKQLFSTSAPGGSNKLQTTVIFDSSSDGNLVQISEGNSAAGPYACPPGLVCQADYTTVNIDGGTGSFANSPYLTWELDALVPGTFNVNKAFVAHYPTGSGTADWVLYWKNRGDRCGSDVDAAIAASPAGACLLSVTLGRTDRATGLAPLHIIFVSDHNGGARY